MSKRETPKTRIGKRKNELKSVVSIVVCFSF